jgi:hypothetical protein
MTSTITMASLQELERDVEDLIKTPATDSLFFSELERKALQLWDQEQELNLEIALLKAQRNGKTLHTVPLLIQHDWS